MSRTPIRTLLAVAFAAVTTLALAQPSNAAPAFSLTQLDSIKASLDSGWTKVPDSVASWYVDEATNSAGHCTDLGGTWSGGGGVIGPVSSSSFPSNDYGIIRVTSAAAVSTPLVDRYSAGGDVTVTGPANSSVGQAVCRSGSTTGWRCGSVTGVNQTVNYGGGDIVFGLVRTNACAEPGDSGGSFVSNPGSGTRVTARGMTSGGSGNCTFGGTTFFQPVTEPLSVFGLTLFTG